MYRSILIAAAALFALATADGHAFWNTARPDTLAAAPSLPEPAGKVAEDFWNNPGVDETPVEDAAARRAGTPGSSASDGISPDCNLAQGCAP